MTATVLEAGQGLLAVEHVEELAGTSYAWVATCRLCPWRAFPRPEPDAEARGREHIAMRHGAELGALFGFVLSPRRWLG